MYIESKKKIFSFIRLYFEESTIVITSLVHTKSSSSNLLFCLENR